MPILSAAGTLNSPPPILAPLPAIADLRLYIAEDTRIDDKVERPADVIRGDCEWAEKRPAKDTDKRIGDP